LEVTREKKTSKRRLSPAGAQKKSTEHKKKSREKERNTQTKTMTKTTFPARPGNGSPPTFNEAAATAAAAASAAAAAAAAAAAPSLSRPLAASAALLGGGGAAAAKLYGLGSLGGGLGGPVLSASGPTDFKDLKEMAGEWRRGERGGRRKESRRRESKT
jgi:hypothetical protein